MLKIKKTANGLAATRINFVIPCYINVDQRNNFKNSVYALADYVLVDKLNKTANIIAETDEDQKKADVATEKLECISGLELSSNADWTSDNKLARCFAIGIGFIKSEAVPHGFVEIYDKAISYAKTYKESTAWDEERKDKFTEIRDDLESWFNVTFSNDERMKEGFSLKISSKAMNGFLDSLYFLENRNQSKGTERTTFWMKKSLQDAFVEAMKAINASTGVINEKKGKTIKVF